MLTSGKQRNVELKSYVLMTNTKNVGHRPTQYIQYKLQRIQNWKISQ